MDARMNSLLDHVGMNIGTHLPLGYEEGIQHGQVLLNVKY